MATPRKRRRPLTQPLLRAMRAALEAALAGEFDGGDFNGMNIEDFERARDWVNERQRETPAEALATLNSTTPGA